MNNNPARQVIRRFGGQSALAQLLGKRQSTVEHWAQTGRIPAQWQQALLAAARQRGIPLEAKDFMESPKHHIEPADGRLGVLTVGLGAVASTVIAGVELITRGLAEPIGSLTQMGTIRLGKRTEERVPLIRDFVPLAGMDQLVFGAWDPIADTAYDAALKCGVLDRHVHIEPIASELRAIEPMPAVFDQNYVRRLDGSNVKPNVSKRELAEALRKDIRDFKATHSCDRMVVIWCASTEIFLEPGSAHEDLDALDAAIDANDRTVPPSMLYAYAALKEGVPFINGAPNLTVDVPAMVELADVAEVPIAGKDFKSGQTLLKTVLAPMLKARMLGLQGWYSTNILGNRDGEVLDDPDSFRTKEETKLGVLSTCFSRASIPSSTATSTTRCASTITRRGVTAKRGGTTSTSSAGSAIRCRSRSISCVATRSWRRRSYLTWCCSRTWPSGRGSRACRSGCRSTSRARSTLPASIPSTTCSSSRRS